MCGFEAYRLRSFAYDPLGPDAEDQLVERVLASGTWSVKGTVQIESTARDVGTHLRAGFSADLARIYR